MTTDIFEALGLDKNPFSMAADTEGYFHTDTTKQILEELAFGILSRKGFLLLTGEVGVGKTSLLFQLLRRLEAEDLVTSWIFNTMLNKEELLLAIARDFGLQAPKTANVAHLIELLHDFMVKQNSVDKNCAIIVDEAHNLSLPALEALRMLSNLEVGGRKLVQILLVAQPELKARMDEPKLRQLRSRVTIYRELIPFTLEETGMYVNFKLAGVSSRFKLSKVPLKILYAATLGNTRMVNLIVERALYAAAAFGDNELSIRALKAAVTEIASCQVEVAERLGKKSRQKKTIAAAAAAFVLLLFVVIPLFPSESGNRSLLGLVLSGSSSPEPEKKSVSVVVPEKTRKIVPKKQGNLVKSGKRENNSLTVAPKKGEKRKNNITKPVSAPKPPKAYRDFLRAVGLLSLLPELGKAVDSGNVAVLAGALPADVQMLKMERLPAQSRVKFSAFPWKHYARGGSAWIALWKPPFIVKDFYYGYRSGDILTLQKMLKKLGYYWGPDDGMVGPLTWRAVNGFQKDMKLKRTMWPDPETVFWLFVMSGGSETLTTS